MDNTNIILSKTVLGSGAEVRCMCCHTNLSRSSTQANDVVIVIIFLLYNTDQFLHRKKTNHRLFVAL